MNEITSFQTLIGTLYKKYNKASVYGILNTKTLFLLNIINKLLYNRPNCLTSSQINTLQNLVIKLQHLDKDICIYRRTESLYTNIIGGYNSEFINSPIQLINTAPQIEDPDPIEPEPGLPPKLCETSKSLIVDPKSKTVFTPENLVECFEDPNDFEEGGIKYIKINSLPLYGTLIYQGINVKEGDLIDVTTLNDTVNIFMYFTPFDQGLDSFKYQVSTISYPDIYNDDNVTMFIKIG